MLREYIGTFRKRVTAHEIEHSRSDHSPVVTPEIMDRFYVRLQQTHEDYHPVDIESIQWLTGQISLHHLLSMPLVSSPKSLTLYNETVAHFKEIRAFFKFGTRIHHQLHSERVSLFQQMDWTANYSIAPTVYRQWLQIHDFLVQIQEDIPFEAYMVSKEPLDRCFESMHIYWDNLLDQVRNHMFSRIFRNKEEHTPFQRSIHWTFFFYQFWTDYDNDDAQLIAIKHHVWLHPDFQSLLKGFINVVEGALNEVCALDVVTVDIDTDLAAAVTFLLHSLKTNVWCHEWLHDAIWGTYNQWVFAFNREDPAMCPKAITAAKVMYDADAMVAAFEPALLGDEEAYAMLMTLRDNVHRLTFNVVLNNSWI